MKQYFKHLGPVIVSLIFALAVYLLYHKLKAYSAAQIRESISQIDDWRLWASVGFMIINYIILVGYDWLALLAIGKKLPLTRTALVSFIGQAVSYNFGALLGGTTVRYRFYSAWGFTIEDIVRLVLMLAVTFWVGALGLCGAVFMVAPPVIPLELLDKMPIKDVRWLGLLLFSIAMTYLVACFFIRKPIKIFNKEFVFPPPRIAIAQALVASVDLIAAAACMYILLPEDLNISFIQFLPSYLMAQVAVVLTHVPGGVGVFELVILHLTHTPREQVVIAAVLCFRIIYFILPLFAAAGLLAAYEIYHRKDAFYDVGRWLNIVSHTIVSLFVFVAGVVLIISSVLPALSHTRAELAVHFPVFVPAAAHFLCMLCGSLLLFMAYGLERRQLKAWKWSVVLLIVGMIAAVFKGLNWLEAGLVFLALASVLSSRRRFYRKSFFFREQIPFAWLGTAWAVFIGSGVGAWYLYRSAAQKAALWGLEQAPNASRNLRAFVIIGGVLALFWLWHARLRRSIIKKSKGLK